MKKLGLLFVSGLLLLAVPALAQYGANVSIDVPYVAPGVLKMDLKADSAAWTKGATVDLTANWDGAWSGHPTADVTATGKLLWTTDTLYVYVKIEDFEKFYWGPPGKWEPWKGEQILIGVDGTHARDTLIDNNWAGWPENAPDKGPVCYKITKDNITLNWYGGGFPVDSGWVRGTVFTDTVNYVWGVEMAIYVPQIHNGAKIGFNIGGANASLEQAMTDTSNMDGSYAYYSWLSAEYPGGDVFHNSKSYGTLGMTTLTSVGPEPTDGQVPKQYVLSQNYPNPFNPSTTIRYALPHSGTVSLAIFNVLGQEIARLVDAQQSAGEHVAKWNANSVGSGLYFYQLRVDNKVVGTKKMMLVK